MFLLIGDLHFQNSNADISRLFHNEILEIITERKPKFVIILGDLLHRHEKIDLFPFLRIQKLLYDIHLTGVELFILVGNHDRPNNKVFMTDEHPFNSFKLWDKTHIIDRTTCFERNKIKFCCVPFVPDGRFMEAISDVSEVVDVFFSHSEFSGCKINDLSGTKCDKWPLDYPLNISGHIHDFERVQENLIYIGTPFQQNFSETSNKGVYILDQEFNLEKISLKTIPKKIYLTVDHKDLFDIKIPEGDVKIKVVGPIDEVKKIMETLKDKFRKVKVVYSDTKSKPLIFQRKNNETYKNRLFTEMRQKTEFNLIFQNLFKNDT